MPKVWKLKPNLDKNSTKQLNLTVLQRTDPVIEEILYTATHVTFYEFDIEKHKWGRKEVEGSLFVVKRSASPRFQFIAMNRLKEENWVENLLGDFEFEIQNPYLFYRNDAGEVIGMWFYNRHECEEVGKIFTRILKAYPNVSSKPKSSSRESELKELETPRMLVIERPMVTSSNAAEGPEDSVFENFSAATNKGKTPCSVPNSSQQCHSSLPHPMFCYASTITSPPSIPSPTLHIPSLLTPVAGSDTTDATNEANRLINLVKPSLFFTPPSSFSPLMIHPFSTPHSTTTTHHLPLNDAGGTPLLQPLPPPTPPPSLTSTCTRISRENVRSALQLLVREDKFIDMIHQALLSVHHL